GMAAALGAQLLDDAGHPLPPGGGALLGLAHVDLLALRPGLRDVEIDVLCDVQNPLCGPNGAARVFGPQKGATPAMVETLDAGLGRLGEVLEREVGRPLAQMPGAGAAGGLADGPRALEEWGAHGAALLGRASANVARLWLAAAASGNRRQAPGDGPPTTGD